MEEFQNNRKEGILDRRLMKCDEVASQLGVTSAYVYLLVKRGEIQAIRLGRSVRIRPLDLEAFLKSKIAPTKKRESIEQAKLDNYKGSE